MILDDKIDSEIRRAISDYHAVRTDHKNIVDISPEIMERLRKLEFLAEFGGLQRMEDEERRAKETASLYARVRNTFAHYIGIRIFEKLNFSFKISRETYMAIGNLVLDNNP